MSEFEERLQKAIDETFALFGPIGRHRIYLRLKDEFKLEPTSLADDPQTLSTALEKIFGRGVWRVVGRAIARKVAAIYAIDFQQDHDLTYADHIRKLKQIAQRKASREHEPPPLLAPDRIQP